MDKNSKIYKMLDKILRLPPVEERKNFRKSIIRPVAMEMGFGRNDKDDGYIYQLCIWRTLQFLFLVSLVFLLSYLLKKPLDLWILQTVYYDDMKLYEFFEPYGKFVSTILCFIIVPYYFLKLRWHINPKTYDVLWFHPKWGLKHEKRKRSLMLMFFLFCYPVLLLTTNSINLAIKNWEDYGIFTFTIVDILILLALLTFAIPNFTALTLFSLAIFNRYIYKDVD